MQQKHTYEVVIEKKYREDYQADYYRAVILDENERTVKYGSEWHYSEERAVQDGRGLIEELEQRQKLAEYGIDFSRMVFTDKTGCAKYGNKGMFLLFCPYAAALVIGILLNCFVGVGVETAVLGLPLLTFFVSLVFWVCRMNRYTGNMASYALYDGDFYRIMLARENDEINLTKEYIGGEETLALIAEEARNGQHDSAVGDQKLFFERHLERGNCWKIVDVQNIVPWEDGYCITCMVEKEKKRRSRKKKLYIRKGYNNFEQLIRCFEYMKACRDVK